MLIHRTWIIRWGNQDIFYHTGGCCKLDKCPTTIFGSPIMACQANGESMYRGHAGFKHGKSVTLRMPAWHGEGADDPPDATLAWVFCSFFSLLSLYAFSSELSQVNWNHEAWDRSSSCLSYALWRSCSCRLRIVFLLFFFDMLSRWNRKSPTTRKLAPHALSMYRMGNRFLGNRFSPTISNDSRIRFYDWLSVYDTYMSAAINDKGERVIPASRR